MKSGTNGFLCGTAAVVLTLGACSPKDRNAADSAADTTASRVGAAVDTAGVLGFVRVRTWLLEPDQTTRTFLEAAGFALDGARRERVTGPAEGDVAGEVRLTADVPQ